MDPLLNNSDKRYHDTTGETTYGSPILILTPVLETGNIAVNTKAILYNLHSEKYRGTAIDNLITCTRTLNINSRHCVTLTDFVELVQFTEQNPAAIVFHPVFPANEQVSRLVGLVTVVFVWKVSSILPTS